MVDYTETAPDHVTNKQWTLQIHKFVHFYCFGSTTGGYGNGCIKRLRPTDIWPEVIPVD